MPRMAGEGAQAIDLFGAGKYSGPCCQLISESFFDAVDASPNVDHTSLEGLPMQAIGRMTSTLAGAQPIAQPRQLTLTSIAQDGDDSQFTGNGTAAFPTLYNRDVLAFFPFQVSQNKFVAAVYVMTSDLTHYYTPYPAPGYTPYDLPPETYQLTIGNVNAAAATVSLTDPLTGQQSLRRSCPATAHRSWCSFRLLIPRECSRSRMRRATTVSTTTLIIPSPPTASRGGTFAPSPPAGGKAGPTVGGNGAGKSGLGVVLTGPARIAVASVAQAGISLLVGCRKLCVVSVTAVPAGRHHAQLVGRATERVAGGRIVRLVLRMSAAGRNWLRSLRKATHIRITASAVRRGARRAIGISKAGAPRPHPTRATEHVGIAVIDWRNWF